MHNGTLPKWTPSNNAKHIRIERHIESEWEVVVNQLSQAFSTSGYLDENVPPSVQEYKLFQLHIQKMSHFETFQDGDFKADKPLNLNATYRYTEIK